jgi:hypothetical protein
MSHHSTRSQKVDLLFPEDDSPMQRRQLQRLSKNASVEDRTPPLRNSQWTGPNNVRSYSSKKPCRTILTRTRSPSKMAFRPIAQALAANKKTAIVYVTCIMNECICISPASFGATVSIETFWSKLIPNQLRTLMLERNSTTMARAGLCQW